VLESSDFNFLTFVLVLMHLNAEDLVFGQVCLMVLANVNVSEEKVPRLSCDTTLDLYCGFLCVLVEVFCENQFTTM